MTSHPDTTGITSVNQPSEPSGRLEHAIAIFNLESPGARSKKQEILFAGKNPANLFSQTIDVLKRESG